MALDSLLGKRLPTSFLPEKDYGYAFLNVQLPAAASLSRTDEMLRKIEKIIAQSEGVRYLGLKIRCPKGRAGSTPALGTIINPTVFPTSINLARGMISTPSMPDGAKMATLLTRLPFELEHSCDRTDAVPGRCGY